MIKDAIIKIVNKGDLTYDEAKGSYAGNHERQDDADPECRFLGGAVDEKHQG